ncbi:MAG: hypothetical protein QOG49_22 [Frankiaceae bacterium]|nr:hypothetical protein [Frankiaceae bacterium]
MSDRPQSFTELTARMEALLAPLEQAADPRRFFLATYLLTTYAVRIRVVHGDFADYVWVERWDVAFADLYLQALTDWNERGRTSRPWTVAFELTGGPRLPPLRHVLLGMNAHVNYDLPQSLLLVITDDEFDDAALVARRNADHSMIDSILASRVAAEDRELKSVEQPGDRTVLDALMTPFNRLGTKRFLTEARAKVWRNAVLLSQARRRGPAAYAARLAELEELSARRVADLRAPGQVLVRLARQGFGVTLPD